MVFNIIVSDSLDASGVAKKRNELHPKVFMIYITIVLKIYSNNFSQIQKP